MYSIKENVLQTVALLKVWGLRYIIVSPGSRNAPLIHCFSQDSFFNCQVVLDEREAAFRAIGLILARRQPTVLCCTSGSAPLNYAPAVAEAYYQNLPLLILSADRPAAWLGQMDGQTLPQPEVFGRLVRAAVTLPEIPSNLETLSAQEAIWHCNRLLNEALIACTGGGLENSLVNGASGPAHVNIPLSEPLFDYSVMALPVVRRIVPASFQPQVTARDLVRCWVNSPRRLIVVGQMFRQPELAAVLKELARQEDCVVLAEHLANCAGGDSPVIGNFDQVLSALSPECEASFAPDLVLSLGGHIVSKRFKQFLRRNKPQINWRLSPTGDLTDTFQSLTELIRCDLRSFLEELLKEMRLVVVSSASPHSVEFYRNWREASAGLSEPADDLPYSDISALGALLKKLPGGCALHLANSSVLRNAQLYRLPPGINVFCNRGVSGIEGSLATAWGFAEQYEGPVYLATGDLSFFYGLNSLWNRRKPANLRIFLLNNGGGGIFHHLPGLGGTASLRDFVAAGHQESAAVWARAAGLDYADCDDFPSLKNALTDFTREGYGSARLLEVFLDMDKSVQTQTDFYRALKN